MTERHMMWMECGTDHECARSLAATLASLEPRFRGEAYVLSASVVSDSGGASVIAVPSIPLSKRDVPYLRAFLNSLAQHLVGLTGYRFAYIAADPEGAVEFERLIAVPGRADRLPGLVISDDIVARLPVPPTNLERLTPGYWWRPYRLEQWL